MLLLLLASACGQEAPQPQPQPRVQAEIPSQGNEDLFPIRYRLKWLHQAQFAGSYMALEKGFYQKRGLDVQILSGGSDFPPYRSLVNGHSDISNLNLMTAVKYYHTGPEIVNLAQISQKNSTILVGKKTPRLLSIEDLNGKKIGIWRDEPGEYVRLFLEYNQYDAQIVPVDWSVNLLLNNAIDLMNAMDYNELHRILMTGWDEKDLIQFDLSDHGFDIVDDGLYTTKEFYGQHPEECARFTEATLEGWIYALAHPEETLDVVLGYLREAHLPANRAHQAWMLGHMRDRVLRYPDAIGYLHPDDFDKVQAILLEHGWISQPVDYKSFYPHEIRKKN